MNGNKPGKIIPFPGRPVAGSALRLRADLLLMPAPVWRRFLCPAGATFWDLHVALQDAFGWEDRHLHQFTLGDPARGARVRFGIPDDSGIQRADDVLPGWRHQVARYLQPGLDAILYVYDFGDWWEHEVRCEAILTAEPRDALPRCLDGEGWAPAEDSGGADAVRRADVFGDAAFAPGDVTFTDPQQRWKRVFADD
jgi:hypothetical protein